MFPFIFEWMYDPSHLIFMGGLWFALSVIGAGMTYCIIKATIDTTKGKDDDHHHH